MKTSRGFALVGVVAGALLIGATSMFDYNTQVKNKPNSTAIGYGCKADGVADDTACIQRALADNSGRALVFPPGTYFCNNPTFDLSKRFVVRVAQFYAVGATFTGGCLWNNTATTHVIGGTFDTSVIVGTGGSPIWLVGADHTSFIDTHWKYSKNYTAIQIAGGAGAACVDDVNIDGIETVVTTGSESHITATCFTNLRINNMKMDGGNSVETGIALFGLTGASSGATITNVTAVNVFDVMQLAENVNPISNVVLHGFTCDKCGAPTFIQANLMGTALISNIAVSNGVVTDDAGVAMVKSVAEIVSVNTPISNVSFSHIHTSGRFKTGTFNKSMLFIFSTGVALDHFSFDDLTLDVSGASGVAPDNFIGIQNDTPYTNFSFSHLAAKMPAAAGPCLSLFTAQFAAQQDLSISHSMFANCNSVNTTLAAHSINNRVVWEDNVTDLAANQPEFASMNTLYPLGVTFAEITGTAYAGAAAGTTLYCFDCAPTTPITSRSSVIGGANCTKLPTGLWGCGITMVSAMWTPVLTFGGASTGITYSTQTATYAQTGNQVTMEIHLILTSKGSATGNAIITGLPVAGASPPARFYSGYVEAINMTGLASPQAIAAFVEGSQVPFQFVRIDGTGASTLTDANFTNTSSLFFSISYHI